MLKQHYSKASFLSSSGLLLLLLCVVTSKAEDVAFKPIVHKVITTVAPAVNHQNVPTVAAVSANQASPTVATTAAPSVANNNLKPTLVPTTVAAKLASSAAPTAAHVNQAKVSPTSVAPAASPAVVSVVAATTIAPVVVGSVNAKSVAPSVAPAAHENAAAKAMSIDEKLEQYFAPVCESVDKLKPKQFFKIQSELKQFVEKTAGKMSVCFMKQYGIDPNLTPITNDHLNTICASRKSPDAKSAYKAFKECANHNWDPQLDKEMERIIAARLNCAKNHNHSKNDTAVSLAHDNNGSLADDESSFISEVVNKVFDEAKAVVNKSDIQVIDMSGPLPTAAAPSPALPASAPTTIKPVAHLAVATSVAPVAPIKVAPVAASTLAPVAAPVAAAATTAAPIDKHPHLALSTHKPTSTPTGSPIPGLANNKKLLNDPNTVVVFVDESGKSTTAAPATASSPAPVVVAKVEAPSKAPVATAASVTAVPATTAAPKAATTASPVKVTTTAPKAATTAASVKVTTASPKAATTAVPTTVKSIVIKIESPTAASTTAAPVVVKVTTVAPKEHKATAAAATTVVPVKAGTAAPEAVVVATTTIAPTKVATTKAANHTSSLVIKINGSDKPVVISSSASVGTTTAKPEAVVVKHHAVVSSTTSKPETAASTAAPTVGSLATLISSTTSTATPSKGTDKPAGAKGKAASQKPARPSDARMHQIEHERQMAIDPIGHTIKHQQYEQAKQQKAQANSAKKE